MAKAGWIFMLFLALQLLFCLSQNDYLDRTGWSSIDCGINDIRTDGMIIWDVDSDYTQTGSNKLVQKETSRDEFNTLRFFPNSTQENCYIVPAERQTIRYIIRAGFYYGNYDGLSSPPTFDLFINDLKWTTVNTSKNNGEPFYEEIMYENNGSGFFKICLKEIKDGGVPFISLLEAVVLWNKMYSQMESNVTYNLVTRTNLGGEELRFDPLNFEEMYNRIWSKGAAPSNCTTSSGFIDVTATYENYPPNLLLKDSVESNGSHPIILTVDLPQSNSQSAYFVFYITELVEKNSSESRSMKIEINGQDQGTVEAPNNGETSVITKYPVTVSGPSINITFTRSNESSLPPMISGMEVFTKWDPNVNQNQNQPPPSTAAGGHVSFAYTLMIPLVFLLVA
ncbi:putative LRR receptor-like serine/threonine-protein kinase At1g07550 [Apium graveolens]|uniref:putative LRR receptor-like serine/threonine-protein kinase At1g07550 n=1 Tax=Apium graveolens TaxID=4045 RepID=UPI003D7B51DB